MLTLPPRLPKPTFAPFFMEVLITVSSAAGMPTQVTFCPKAEVVKLLRLAITLLFRPTSRERWSVFPLSRVRYMVVSALTPPRILLVLTTTLLVLLRVGTLLRRGW